MGGDELAIDVDVDADAHALVTTPAAGKVYRTTGAPVRQTQRLRVADRRHAGVAAAGGDRCTTARARRWRRASTSRRDARFIGIDAVCFGLPARRAPFARGRCRQTFELRRDGRPLLIERGLYDAQDGGRDAARWGLGGAMRARVRGGGARARRRETVEAVRARAAAAPDGDLAR